MAVVGTADAPLEIFGGLVTDMAPADLPAGVSPDCQDVAFVPGSVKTRPGLLSIFSPIGGTPAVNYLKTYVPQSGLLRLLALDAAGSLWKESSVGVLSLISSGIVPASYGKSASLFTREYLAIGDGKYGIDIPRQFDDTNFDRVSQVGPGIAPVAQDEATQTQNLVASPNGLNPFVLAIVNSPNGLSESGNVVTVTLTGGGNSLDPSDKVGDLFVLAGAGVGGYNGTFPIASIISLTQFTYINQTSGLAASGGGNVQLNRTLVTMTAPIPAGFGPIGRLMTIAGAGVAGYNGTWTVRVAGSGTTLHLYITGADALAASGGGTISNAGSITAGIHKVSVVFKTRQGYITAPAPPQSWTAAGSNRVVVSNIPTGPSNIVARILLFTLAGQSFFFYTSGITGVFSSNLIINDNTTTSVTVDFTDLGLSSGISADSLFKLQELGECSGVIDYSSRLFWWGERNKVGNFNNLTFDGGFATGAHGPPLGWNFMSVSTFSFPETVNVVWGGAFKILGDGATSNLNGITQSAFQDSNGVPILQPNVAYSVRARIRLSGVVPNGAITIDLHSLTLGGDLPPGLTVQAAQLSSTFQEFSAPLTGTPMATVPSDVQLQILAAGNPPIPNNAGFIVDCIEVYPTNQPFNSSLVRASNVELPENYDGVTGFLNVSENDGFAVRSAGVIRENLYFVKEHGIYVTQDDTQQEPSLWKITEVSRKVGTPSVNGFAYGPDWGIIADRTGAYFFAGSEPAKISQEIQPTWDRINWAAGQSLWVQIDLQNKRVYFGVPLDAATKPSAILMMDYRGIEKPDEIATAAPIHTSYSGKLLVLEKSRKWSIWNITANSGTIVERFDGTQKTFLGNGSGTGKVYQLSDTQFTDDGVTIAGYYNTYFHFTHDLEQVFQMGSHNKLFTYMSQFVEGSGTLVISAIPPGNAPPIPITNITLANPALRDIEFPINVTAVRSSFKLTTANNGDWFRLARFIVNAIKHPSAPVRGWN